MSDLSGSVTKFRAWRNSQRRPRDSVVCIPCKRSKLRCNREQPCSTCVKKDLSEFCSYDRSPKKQSDKDKDMPVEDRLKHLEGLVKHLMESHTPSGEESTPDYERIPVYQEALYDPNSSAQPSANRNQVDTSYAGYTHWSAILDDVQELKMALSDLSLTNETEKPSTLRRPADREPLFGFAKACSLKEIISWALPSRSQTDRLSSIYFSGEIFIVPFLHTRQFQREYEQFWNDPGNVNPLWLSILFSTCYVGSLAEPPIDQSKDDLDKLSSIFLNAAGQCLVIGQYFRPQPFVVEALISYAYCKNLRNLDPNREAGTVVGIAVRLAYEMGYHRDPEFFGSFSTFEGEMRRRMWSTCKQLDVMMSFMLGLPSNIIVENCDTRSPRNLLDSDFDVDTEVLPPSRPEQEETMILWFIVKERVLDTFSKVCRDALSFKQKSELEVIELDREIRQMRSSTPRQLQPHSSADSAEDSPHLILVRLYLEFLSLKSLCILHRKYMARGGALSTTTCVEAGKSMVIQFIELHEEFKPGGRLDKRSRMLTNFTVNDYLMGVMVLCHALYNIKKKGHSVLSADTEQEIRGLLQQSHAICLEKSQASRDARRVSYAIQVILSDSSRLDMTEQPRAGSTAGSVSLLEQFPCEQDDVPSISLMQSGGASDSPFGVFDPFGLVMYDTEDIDFEMFDQQFGQGMPPP